MSVHPIHQTAATPVYEPGFDLPAQTIQNEPLRLEGLAKMMAYHADGSAHAGADGEAGAAGE